MYKNRVDFTKCQAITIIFGRFEQTPLKMYNISIKGSQTLSLMVFFRKTKLQVLDWSSPLKFPWLSHSTMSIEIIEIKTVFICRS